MFARGLIKLICCYCSVLKIGIRFWDITPEGVALRNLLTICTWICCV